MLCLLIFCIFDGRCLFDLNAKYYFINSVFLDIDTITDFLHNKEISNSDAGKELGKTFSKEKKMIF